MQFKKKKKKPKEPTQRKTNQVLAKQTNRLRIHIQAISAKTCQNERCQISSSNINIHKGKFYQKQTMSRIYGCYHRGGDVGAYNLPQ